MSKSAGSGIIDMLKLGMSNWDSGWYINLVETGYHWNGDSTAEQTAAISFMFPLMSLIFKWVFRTSSWAAVAGTNMLCSYFVLLLLYRLSMIITDGDTYKADLAVTLLAFAPGNIYMTAGLLEGALLLWIVLGLLFLERKQYLGFAFCMGCAVGVNTTAVFGAVVLVLDYWFINRHKATLKNVGRFIGYGVLTVWGILAQMMYFAYKFSDPFAMFKAQTAWGNGVVGNKSFNIKGIIRLLAIPVTNFSELLYNDDYIVSLFFLAIAAFVIALAVKTKFKLSRLDWLDMLFVLGAMSVVLLTSLQPDHVSRHAVRCALIIPLFLKHVRNDVLKKVSHLSVAVCVYFSFITAVQFSYHME
jgi:hypothetical protein